MRALVFLLHVVLAVNVHPRPERYTPDYSVYTAIAQLEEKVRRLVARDSSGVVRSQRRHGVLVVEASARSHFNTSSADGRVLFVAGQHPREFLPTEAVLSLIEHLVENPDATRRMLGSVSLVMIPLLNEEGRRVLEERNNYCWRGNGRGVDLERNFDWHFGGASSSSDPSDELYRGSHAASERETQALISLVDLYAPHTLISLHSGTRALFPPYVDTAHVRQHARGRPREHRTIKALADAIDDALPRYFQRHLQYAADGTSVDYFVGSQTVPVALNVELWGQGDVTPSCFDLFNPPSEALVDATRTLRPALLAVVAFAQGHDWSRMETQNDSELLLWFVCVCCVLAVLLLSLLRCCRRRAVGPLLRVLFWRVT